MTNLHRLHRPFNQSPWLDNLSRDLINSGKLHNYINQGVRGMTSNPTILENAILSSSLYDEQIKRLAYEGSSTEDIYWRIVIDDIKSATQAFLPLWHETDGEDGYVSLEVSPKLAHDATATLEQARWIWKEIGAPNLMVKVPATEECLPIIETLLSEGINVNVTLIFSLRDYKKVAQAHVESHKKNRDSYARSVASLFISRIDTEVDKRLEAIGSQEALAMRGKAALSQAHLAYDIFLDAFAKSAVLDSDSSAIQRLLWASTSTKNPEYDDLLYITNLIAPVTINTLPEDTIDKVLDHLPNTARSLNLIDIDEALATTEALRAVGIDFNDVADALEREGVEKFDKSFDSLIAAIDSKK
jgi:transaldolase